MQFLNSLKNKVFQITEQNFEPAALELFTFQYKNNNIYREYVKNLNIRPEDVDSIFKIPFLPIRFFKSHVIQTGDFLPEKIFESSGTSGETSKHYIEDLNYYKKVCENIFSSFFGQIHDSIILGLLPSYLERENSSLVFMVNDFIAKSKNTESGFYLNEYDALASKLETLKSDKRKIILFGVSFALIEFSNNYSIDHEKIIVIETGGMKGRGKELIREDLHQVLKSSFNAGSIFSEYGMTELLSQAYMKSDGFFYAPPWMKVLIREVQDPFNYIGNGKTGGINVIDLANVHSCAFIETEDLGLRSEQGFQVLGRLDNSDIRGCNLLLS